MRNGHSWTGNLPSPGLQLVPLPWKPSFPEADPETWWVCLDVRLVDSMHASVKSISSGTSPYCCRAPHRPCPHHRKCRGLSDGDLKKLGISDGALAKQRQGGDRDEGVFEAQKLRALLLGLVCTAEPADPAPLSGDGKALFEDFEYIEGYPHVCDHEGRRG